MKEDIKNINAKILAFKRRYYLSFFIRGVALTLFLSSVYFLIISLIEHTVWMSPPLRFFALLSAIVLFACCVVLFLKKPLAWWLYRKGLSTEQSAKIVGSFFPAINDKLLNLIQLAGQKKRTGLLKASIHQKAKGLEGVAFEKVVDSHKNKRYLWLLVAPLGMMTALLFAPSMLTQSARRIVRFDQNFSPPAPFFFQILNKNMDAFAGEDFTLNLHVKGTSLPPAVYIQAGEQTVKMDALSEGYYTYTFKKMQQAISFFFEAETFRSPIYHINLAHRPELTRLRLLFDFPNYLSLKNTQTRNTGSFEVPEGTRVIWEIGAQNTSWAKIKFFSSGVENTMTPAGNSLFASSLFIKEPEKYAIILENEKAKNREKIAYSIAVIKDRHPKIAVNRSVDSISFKTLLLGGQISDDYGITALTLHYKKTIGGKEGKSHIIPIAINTAPQQSFFYPWQLDLLNLGLGEQIHYFLEVWDNDGVNGHKFTRSATYTFALPGDGELKMSLDKSRHRVQTSLLRGMKSANALGVAIDKANQELKGKQRADWQDKKLLEDILRKKDSLYQSIQQLQQQSKLLNRQREALLKHDEHIVEKARQIQRLMEELLDEKTKALFEELQKLLSENADLEQIKDVLDKMDSKENDIEHAFERMLELLDHFRFDVMLDQTIMGLDDLIKEQEELLKETGAGTQKNKGKEAKQHKKKNPTNRTNSKDKKNVPEPSAKDLAGKQNFLLEKAQRLKEELDKLKKAGQKIDREAGLPESKEADAVKDAQEQSRQRLEENDRAAAKKWQQKSIDKLKDLYRRLKKMQDALQMAVESNNREALRHILHGLIKLSHDQEDIINKFLHTPQDDPVYNTLSRRQLKTKNDFKVLKDSLLSLSSEDPFINSIIVREITDLSRHLNKTLDNLQEGKRQDVSAEMQWSMTRMNNLALMLDAHFDMMKNGRPSVGKGKKRMGMPGLSEMQKQLNQRIQELKKGGKSGHSLSEELARMAAEQERIRRAFQRMQRLMEQKGGQAGSQGIADKMEKTEMDLVNKRITQQTLLRQQDILSRLLDAEKAMREQGMDEERKGSTATDYEKKLPKTFEEYLRIRQKEVELLKTVPPELNPYYKKEVSQYFDRIKSTKRK